MVRVLVLVDEDVPERLLPALTRLGEPLEHLDGEHEQVVEVDRVRGVKATLVEAVDVGNGLVVEGLDAARVLVRRDELVLRVRDLGVDAARDESLRVALQLLQAVLRQPHLVGLVVDGEIRLVAQPRRLPAQDPAARSVEREDPDRPRRVPEEVFEARAHLARRLVRERDREDLVRLRAGRGDQMGDATREEPRLPRACARDDEERPFRLEDSLTLCRIEVGEVLLGSQDRLGGHVADAR